MCHALDWKERLRWFASFLSWVDETEKQKCINRSMVGLMATEVALLRNIIDARDTSRKQGKQDRPALSQNPHMSGISLDELSRIYDLPDLIPALQYFQYHSMHLSNS